MLAPWKTPPAPKGRNGRQCAALTWEIPTTMKKRITTSLTTTMTLLTRLLAFVPSTSTSVRSSTTSAAGRLRMPPAKGEAVSAFGKVTPKAPFKKSTA